MSARPGRPSKLAQTGRRQDAVTPEVADLIRRILAGESATELSSRSTRELLEQAADHFVRAGETDPGEVRGFLIEATRHLYRQMVEAGDYHGALKALRQLWLMER